MPTLITTSKWFLKKRLFANSVTILGACLGAALYPLLSEFILTKYELFDTLFILSGVQLNCFIGSILMRERKASSYLVGRYSTLNKCKLNTNLKHKKIVSQNNLADCLTK